MNEPPVSVESGGFFAKGNITIKGPVTHYSYYGWGSSEGLTSVMWDLANYFGYLDLARFTGRRELIARIGEFIDTKPRGWVVIQGEAGVGKSALAAYLVSKHDWFHHFTWFSDAKSPESARKNLAAQLISVFGLDDRAPGGDLPAHAGQPKYLASVLRDAAAKRDKETAGRPIVLVIDTLAEMEPDGQNETPMGLPRADELPHKVFIIVTQRPAPPLREVRNPILPLHITADEGRRRDTGRHPGGTTLRDMREYLKNLFGGDDPDRNLVDKLHSSDKGLADFIGELVTRSGGSWIYVKYVLDDIRIGNRALTDAQSLPPGLRDLYLDQLQRQRKRDQGAWQRIRLPALATLAALRRPATVRKLADLAGITDAADLIELRSWLDEDIRALLHKGRPKGQEDGEPRYEIRHQSLRDTVAAPDPPRQPSGEYEDEDGEYVDDDLSWELRNGLRTAHAAITADLIPPGRDWPSADRYVRDMLAEHAANADRLDDLVTDPGFLLICRPSTVLLRRRYLKSPAGIHAISAYEAALSEWAGLPPDDDGERAWRLHVWARKTGASRLADTCLSIARRSPTVRAAMWTGITHRTMQAHDRSVGTVTVLPVSDGRPLLASGGGDGRVRLWDPDTGEPQGDLLRDPDPSAPQGDPRLAHDDSVTAALALPGQRVVLVTGARDGTVRLWDPQTRRPFPDPVGHDGPVTAMATVRLADDRTVLATVGRDGIRLRSWDPDAQTLGRAPLTGCDDWVTAAAAVPVLEGQLLVTGTANGQVRFWDPRTGEPIGDPLTDHSGQVNAIAAVRLPDDRTVLATGGRDGMMIRSWDLRTWKPIGDPLTYHSDPVNAITVARPVDRTWFVAAGRGRTIRLWDAETGAGVLPALSVRARGVNAIAAIPMPGGSTVIATGGSNGGIELPELYESSAGAPAAAPSTGHHGPVNAIAVTRQADQKELFVSGSRDGTLRLWDPLTGAPVGAPVADDLSELIAVAAVPADGGRNLIATSGADGIVQVWDPAKIPPTSRPMEAYSQVYAIAAVQLPERTLLATGGSDGTVRLWNPDSGQQVGAGLAGHAGKRVNTILPVRLPNKTTMLVTGGSDGTVQFWDPAAGVAAADHDPLAGHIGRILALAQVPLPDGRTLLAASGEDGLVETWDGLAHAWDGSRRHALIGPPADQRAQVNAITAVQLRNRTLLATGDQKGKVRLWDLETGEQAVGAWVGHVGPVKTVASVRLPGGPTLLASGGEDKTILIWTFG
jgi:WD40 repeat protein